LVHESSA